MKQDYPQVEPLPRFERHHHRHEGDEAPWHRSGRLKLFVTVFGVVLVLGVIWTALQPVVYRSSATVLMSAPTAIDAGVSEANIQNVAIQRTILLGDEITARVLGALSGVRDTQLQSGYLREVLHVDPVPDTNLIEMVAQGAEEELLPILVDTWINVYVDARADDIEQRKDLTLELVQDELDGLAIKIEQARDSLEQYRDANNIVSAKREENEVLSRLDGLNKALNNAIEEEVKAEVYLDTLREARNKGQVVVPKGDRGSVQSLDNELQRLRAQMVEMNKRYTMEYIEKQPQLRAIPQRIAELEGELATRVSQGQEVELANAQQSYFAARRAVQELERKLDEHKQKVSKFNRIYATHEALAEDLSRLEALNRETQARLVQVEVRQVEKYPQVSVIEGPGGAERIGPDYLLMLGGTLGAALGLGVFSVWLMGFLSPKRDQPAYVTLSGVHLYPQEVSGQLGYSTQPDASLAQDSAPRLDARASDAKDKPASGDGEI